MVAHAQHGLLPVTGGVMTPGVPALARQAAGFLVRHLQAARLSSGRAQRGPDAGDDRTPVPSG